MIGPIISTAMVSKGFIWSRFYVVVLAIRVICFFFAGWAFWGLEREAATQLLSALERTATNRAAAEAGEPTKFQLLKQAVKNRVTLMGALFIFAYQGAEVATSGWVISFLISYRDGDPAKVGYVSAGFWVRGSLLNTTSNRVIMLRLLTNARPASRSAASSSRTSATASASALPSTSSAPAPSSFSSSSGWSPTSSGMPSLSPSSACCSDPYTRAARPSSRGCCRTRFT